VAAHLVLLEELQGTRQIRGRVVQDDELRAAVLAERGMATIDAGAAGTTGKQRRHGDEDYSFHEHL